MELIRDLGRQKPKEDSRYKVRYGLYRCVCGKEVKVMTQNIKNGRTSSCGCLTGKKIAESNTSHGMSRSRIYKIWQLMVQRTQNKKNTNYKYYGAIGITICEDWLIFENFLRDMKDGYKDNLTIDRIDTNKGYSIENCRWATNVVQHRNTRKLISTNKSGYRGVSFDKKMNKWSAQIYLNNKKKHLGYFKEAIDGAIAYDKYILDNSLEHTINEV